MPSIVIIGGGFAGLNAALAAVRVGEDRISVTLVSRDPWLTVRPRLYESNPVNLRTELIRPLSAVGAQLVVGEATEIDDHWLVLETGERIPFDRLVVATGSVMQRIGIPGEHLAFSVDDWSSAIAFDARLNEIAQRPAPRVVIIGAGFTGIELVLEMRDRIAAHAGSEAGERAQIFLLDRANEVGPDLGPGPRPVISDALASAGITTLLGVELTSIGAGSISFVDGTELPCDMVVLCTGLRAAPFVEKIVGEKDRFGRLMVDSHLRVGDMPAVFGAGDACCASPDPGRQTLMSCQHALTLGKFAGENAARDLLGQPLLPYSQVRYVTCLALGRSGAVFSEGWDRVPVLTGDQGRAVKTEINTRWIYPVAGSREEILAGSRI